MRRGCLMLHIAKAAATGRGMRLSAAEVQEVRDAIGVVALQCVSPLAAKRMGLYLDESGKSDDWARVDPVRDARADHEPKLMGDSAELYAYLRANGLYPR